MFPTSFLLATSNPHKVAEFQAILAPSSLRLMTADECGLRLPEVAEDGPTAEAIARRKAETMARFSGRFALADDTVLEVDALDGRPGLRTARYAGPHASREDNCRKLLQALEGVALSERNARFVCCLHLASADGQTAWSARGECYGRIRAEPCGEYGFGYDSYFWIDETECTMAELSDDQRCQVTHRARACRRLLEEARFGET